MGTCRVSPHSEGPETSLSWETIEVKVSSLAIGNKACFRLVESHDLQHII